MLGIKMQHWQIRSVKHRRSRMETIGFAQFAKYYFSITLSGMFPISLTNILTASRTFRKNWWFPWNPSRHTHREDEFDTTSQNYKTAIHAHPIHTTAKTSTDLYHRKITPSNKSNLSMEEGFAPPLQPPWLERAQSVNSWPHLRNHVCFSGQDRVR